MILGTIPARAGETLLLKVFGIFSKDHPRSRGGNVVSHTVFRLDWGPSPLARGKLWCVACTAISIGTIPARAGETDVLNNPELLERDHPRSRGGNSFLPLGE